MEIEKREITIILFGRTGVGKSNLADRIIGQKIFKEGHTLDSQTSTTSSYVVNVGNYVIKVIDTPGFADNRPEITNEQLIANILAFVKTLDKGFNIGIYCISPQTRLDVHNIEEIRLLGMLLGESVFNHTYIAVTQTDTLEGEALQKVYRTFPIDLPRILDEHGIRGFSPDRVLFAGYKDFEPKFMKPLRKIMETASIYSPKISKDIDPNNPESIKRFLAAPEIQAVIKHYEEMLNQEREKLKQWQEVINKQAEENKELAAKSRQEREELQQNLNYLNQQLTQSQNFSKELQATYSKHKEEQEQELIRVKKHLQEQEEQRTYYQKQIEQKEMQFNQLTNRINDLERIIASQSQPGKSSNGLWDFIGGVVKIFTRLIF